jgi:serine/threonine-protein kinase
MGAVYRATDQILQRTVAIKVLKVQGGEEQNARIRLEAQILARLLHDNIVRLYDFGEAAGTFFLIMEEVDGSSFLRRWKHMPLLDRLGVLAQVADALDYAHRQGVIHRDVKPANVLLTLSDQAKLSDFGLSMRAEQKDESGLIRGTPHYMSPEQTRARALDHRSDLYSLGVMLYETTAGTIPFQGTAMSLLVQHREAAPEPPRARNPEISGALESLILHLMAKDPDARPVSGAWVARALREEIEQEQGRRGTPTAATAVFGAPNQLEAAAQTVAMSPANPITPAAATEVRPVALAPKAAPPLARAMLEEILAEPLPLTPEERYLCGHYLAYLLGGSRRRGIFLRRPLDPRNADRARLILAMTSVIVAGASEESIARAAELLDTRPDVRPSLNPIVVAKYLGGRATPAKRKRFRQFRKQLLDASTYAQKSMVDINGVLNPGMIPQALDDLRLIAPEQSVVDDQLVSRWNRIAEVWHDDPEFRTSVLSYATKNAARDPASIDLWPEVVYPLIERVRWQRQSRNGAEAVWDYFCAQVLHVPDAGVRLDRAIQVAVPSQVIEKLDVEVRSFTDEMNLDFDMAQPEVPTDSESFSSGIGPSVSLHELAADKSSSNKNLVPLNTPDPIRFLQSDLRELYDDAVAAMRTPGARSGHRTVPIGPYRLAVIPSIRGRSAGQVAIQGMPNKQIDIITPSIRLGGSGSKPIIAAWVYQDQSLVVTHLDFKGNEQFILWHAPLGQQYTFDDPGKLNHILFNLGLEAPDQLDRALSKRFRPRNAV